MGLGADLEFYGGAVAPRRPGHGVLGRGRRLRGRRGSVAVDRREMARERAWSGSYRRSVRVRESRELPGDEGDHRGRVLMDMRPPSVGWVG